MTNKYLINVNICSINDFYRPNYFRLFPLILQINLVIYNGFNRDVLIHIINRDVLIHIINDFYTPNRIDYIIADQQCSQLTSQLMLIEIYQLKVSRIEEGIDLYVESDNYN